ncbi:MAG: hypothetical protein DLM62_06010 [Pseudonocardiales bacterium]|nr:MAG: hypothetical protein DLM62_06010 [Pseudonocardiales bacterium]
MNGSYISATTGELHSIPAADPVLQLTFKVEAGGLSDGAPALFLIGGSIHAVTMTAASARDAVPQATLILSSAPATLERAHLLFKQLNELIK